MEEGEVEEIGYCPECGGRLENYSQCEGGWCSDCAVWWPADIVKDWMEENE